MVRNLRPEADMSLELMEMPEDTVEDSRKRLKGLLRGLFQFDVADLDFGIYKIMNQRREEIEKFIERDLLAKTEEAFKEYVGASSETLKTELEALRDRINEELGAGTIDERGEVVKHKDVPMTEKYLRKQEEMSRAELTRSQIDDVYNQVYEFFSRYFDKGDFFSKRRYGGKDKYVIQYNGEEVMLHWANKDQYYVKTGENFTNYGFKADGWTVRFVLVHAEVEQDNLKGQERFFIISEKTAPTIDGKKEVLTIAFQYRKLTEEEEKKLAKKNRQDQLMAKALEKILKAVSGSPIESLLVRLVPVSDETSKKLIEKHLERYVKKNTTDYFIHKDLKGFLTRELDYFIKNEVLQVDEFVGMSENAIKRNMARVRAIRDMCTPIIEFLAQVEDFQKMLFEKKKFVLRTEYCMTLDNVPKELYPEIAANKEQVAEWKRLFKLDEITDGTLASTRGKNSLDVAFLEGHPFLVLDTRFLDEKLRDRLMASFENIDLKLGGLLVKSENWQALNLLMDCFRERIDCIYCDPPYNTGNDEFLYKDSYQHSSWLTMIENRLSLMEGFAGSNCFMFASCDKNESMRLRLLLDRMLPGQFVNDIANVNNPQGRSDEHYIATAHENLLIYATAAADSYDWPAEGKVTRRYRSTNPSGEKYREVDLRKTGEGDRRVDRPNLFYYFYYNPDTKELYPSRDEKTPNGLIQIKPIKPDGSEGRWRWELETAEADIALLIPKKMERRDVWTVYEMDVLEPNPRVKPTSLWDKKSFNSQRASESFIDLGFDKTDFPHPKPVDLIKHILMMSTSHDSYVLDAFAGSGTTGQAVLSLNNDDGIRRKYILIDFSETFYSILVPRIVKTMFSSSWSEGKPSSDTGCSHLLKYLDIEQNEDTLSNIVFRSKSKTIQETLQTYDDYFMRYILDYETRDSPARLSVDAFKNPFDYRIKTVSGGEENARPVDLVETFNYLLGLHVERLLAAHDGKRYYKAVRGRKRDGKSVLVVWRGTEGIDLKRDKEFIEKEFLRGWAPDIIYVNGMCHVKGGQPIESVFKRLMGA